MGIRSDLFINMKNFNINFNYFKENKGINFEKIEKNEEIKDKSGLLTYSVRLSRRQVLASVSCDSKRGNLVSSDKRENSACSSKVENDTRRPQVRRYNRDKHSLLLFF